MLILNHLTNNDLITNVDNELLQQPTVGVNDFNEPPYMVESIDGEDYTVVQKEKIYKHRMKVKKEKLRKL